MGAGAAAAFAKFLLKVAIAIAVSKLLGPKVPKGRRSEHSIMTYSAIEHHKIVYGQAMISGPVVFSGLSGSVNENLWYQIALTRGRIDSVVSVWLDGEEIPVADIDWTANSTAGTGTGAVSTTRWIGNNLATALRLYYYLGYDTQTVNVDLNTAFTEITAADRMRGLSYVIAQLSYDVDTENVWEQGPPRDIKVVVKGRLVYDPRKDSTVVIDPDTSPPTFGSGAHRYTDSTTWEFSDNPALCLADYLTQIMTADPALDIDWPSFATAADDCDVLVEVPPAASPANTQKRFVCNGALSMGDSHKDNLTRIQSAMNGSLMYIGGKWHLRASTWVASSVSFDGSDIAGRIDVQGSAARDDRFNTVRGHFADSNRNYEKVEFPHVSNSAFVTRDGREIHYDMQLPMTNDPIMAQRIAFRNLNQGDKQTTMRAVMDVAAVKCAVGDTVTWNLPQYGWTDISNRFPYSEDFTNAAWTKERATITLNTIAGPTGKKNGSLIANDGNAGATGVHDSMNITAGDAVWIACKAKKLDYDWASLRIDGNAGANYGQAYYDLRTGELGSIDESSYSVLDYGTEVLGAGWFLCWLVVQTNTDTAVEGRLRVAEGDLDDALPASSGTGCYFTEAHIDIGSEVGIYLETTGAVVTNTPKTFRVIEWQAVADGTFEVTFKEDDAAAYADPLVSDYSTTAGGSIVIPGGAVPAPSGLTATAKQLAILLEWTNPPAGTYDYIDIYEGVTNGWNDSPGPTKIAEVRADSFLRQLNGGDTRYYWIRARRAPTIESLREPNNDTTTVFATAAAASVQVNIALSGEVITHSGSAAPGKAGIQVKSNGTLFKREGDTYTQIDSPEWCDPPEFAPGLYEFKCDSGVSPDNLDAGSDAEGTWLAVTTTREWLITTVDPSTKENDVVVRVRRDGGAEIDSATFELNASVGSYSYSVPTDTVTQNVAGTSVDPIAGYRATSTGENQEANYNSNQSADWTDLSDYLTPKSDVKADDLQIRATQSSQTGGGTLSGTLNTWEALSATRTWTITRTALTDGTSEWVLDIDIRDNSVSPPTTVASGTMTLRAIRIVI